MHKPLTITITLNAENKLNLSLRAQHDACSEHTDLQVAYSRGLMEIIAEFAKQVGETAEASGTGYYGLAVGGLDLDPHEAEAQVHLKKSRGNN